MDAILLLSNTAMSIGSVILIILTIAVVILASIITIITLPAYRLPKQGSRSNSSLQ